jgi:hypothetical protein
LKLCCDWRNHKEPVGVSISSIAALGSSQWSWSWPLTPNPRIPGSIHPLLHTSSWSRAQGNLIIRVPTVVTMASPLYDTTPHSIPRCCSVRSHWADGRFCTNWNLTASRGGADQSQAKSMRNATSHTPRYKADQKSESTKSVPGQMLLLLSAPVTETAWLH